jgi:cell division protease FtsH
MVTRFGMSDVIGLMAVGDSEQEVFLGRELVQRREVSEHTAQQVDQEVKRILDEAHGRARTVVLEHQELMDAIAQALLERETIGREELEALDRGEPLPEMQGVPPMLDEPGPGAWGRLSKPRDGEEEAAVVGGPGGPPVAVQDEPFAEGEEAHEESPSRLRFGQVEPGGSEGDVPG